MNYIRAHHPNNCLILNNRNQFSHAINVVVGPPNSSLGCKNGKRNTTNSDDNIDFNENHRPCERNSSCKRRRRSQHQQQQQHLHHMPQKCIINDNNAVQCANNLRYLNKGGHRHHNHGRRKKIIEGARYWYGSSSRCHCSSVWFLFCVTISLLLLNIDIIRAEPPHQQQPIEQCEPKVLEETPPDPVNRQFNILFSSLSVFSYKFTWVWF